MSRVEATESPGSVLPTGEQVHLRWEDQHAVVVQVGAGIRTYHAGERPLIDGYGEEEMSHGARGQILSPWPNRLKDGRYEFDGDVYQVPLTEPAKGNAIHGLLRWTSWEIVDSAPKRVRLEHLLPPQAGYPFMLRVSVTYELGGDGLTVSTTATNLGKRPCPYGTGAHPYLRLGGDRIDSGVLQAPGEAWLENDDRGIPVARRPVAGSDCDFREPRPIGATVLDTAFTDLRRDDHGRAWVRLWEEQGDHGVALWMDDAHAFYMLFTGDSLSDPDQRRRSLGVEPMTCAPNAFRSGDGVTRLNPGHTVTARYGIRPLPVPG